MEIILVKPCTLFCILVFICCLQNTLQETTQNQKETLSYSPPSSKIVMTPGPDGTTTLPNTVISARTGLSENESDGPELVTDSLDATTLISATDVPEYFEYCPSQLNCDQLSADCLNCQMNASCTYGHTYNVTCTPMPGLDCIGEQQINRTYNCRYCYQTQPWEQICTPANNCAVNACPKQMVQVNCSVLDDIICLGNRRFYRKKECNWTSGVKWSTAFILSITLGGFGVDRFYLGYWESGLGKLFSFGGIGIWTLIDILLIGVGYIPPEDGSVYV